MLIIAADAERRKFRRGIRFRDVFVYYSKPLEVRFVTGLPPRTAQYINKSRYTFMNNNTNRFGVTNNTLVRYVIFDSATMIVFFREFPERLASMFDGKQSRKSLVRR